MDINPVLLRIVYASRSLGGSERSACDAELRAILATARTHNAANDITGLLIVANGHFLQVLEGAAETVDSLYARIAADVRHRSVVLLSRVGMSTRSFGSWSMGLVERAEPEAATLARQQILLDQLSVDPEASAADFCRLILAPSVNPMPFPRLRVRPQSLPISSVAFASPTGLWSAAVLQYLSSTAMRRTGRTTVRDPDESAQRTLIEYIDVESPDIGPVRALSLAAGPETFAPIGPLMERLSLLVFMMAASDAADFMAYVCAWLALPQVVAAAPRVLVLAGVPPGRVVSMLETLRAGTALSIDFASVKLSDSAAVWRAAQWPLRGQIAIQRAAVGAAHASVGKENADKASAPAATEPMTSTSFEPQPKPMRNAIKSVLPISLDANNATQIVSDAGCLRELLDLDGAIAAGLIDADSGATLLALSVSDAAPHSFDGDAAFVRGKRQLLSSLRLEEPIEDIAITTRSTLCILRALPPSLALFVAVVFDRERVQLGMARLCLQEIVSGLAATCHPALCVELEPATMPRPAQSTTSPTP